MIIDLISEFFKKDPLAERNVLKTVSWRIVGSIDTMVIGWMVTGQLGLVAKIAIGELLTKMLLYYFHERLWNKISVRLPTKRVQTKLIQNEVKPHLFKQTGKVSRRDREELNHNQSYTIWLTGLSGAGKSTLATEIEAWIHHLHGRIYILDGDNTRLGINSDLSFSDEDRSENIRRVAELCRLFNDAGVIVIASFISPFLKDRVMAKKLIGVNNFVEVFVDASLSVCCKRDPKGLYKLASMGKISNFTGIDSPYEQPVFPDIHVKTELQSIDESLSVVKKYLIANKLVSLDACVVEDQ